MKELIERWRSELPDFWRKVRNGAIWLVGVCTTIYLSNSSMELNLPESVLTICKYGMVFGTATGLNAQLTKKDNDPEQS